MSQPQFTVTEPTPQVEKASFVGDADGKAITEQPSRKEEMTMNSNDENLSVRRDSNGESNDSESDYRSGYEREQNECTEFCLDCLSCFGLFDVCCPDDGEGCLTSFAVFWGNIFVSCCKC